jgi:hypothetical protein
MKRLTELKSLCCLSLYFDDLCSYSGGLTDETLMDLSKGIKQLKTLSSLQLHFYPCYDLTNVSVIELANSLKQLKLLKRLSINFNHCTNLIS